MASSLAPYGNNMRAYLDTLEPTNIDIIYFGMDERQPHIRSVYRKFTEDRVSFLVNCGTLGHWVYTYQLNAIRHLFVRVQSDVQAFIGTVHAPYAVEGGARFDVASMGNHLTVGLQMRQQGRLYMKSHFTEYVELPNFEFQTDRSMDCTLELDSSTPSIDRNARCLGRPPSTSPTVSDVYQAYPLWVRIMERWKRAFLGMPQDGGWHRGPRGGVYALQGGKKRYVRRQQTTGGARGPRLTDEMIDVIYAFVVRPVLQHFKDSHVHFQAKLLYDEDNVFECEVQHIILMYENSELDNCKLFYLEAEKVAAAIAYHTGTPLPVLPHMSPKACWQEMERMATAHIQQLEPLAG